MLVTGNFLIGGAGLREHLVDTLNLCGDICLGTVKFAQQDGGRLFRVAGIDKFFDRLDGRFVEQFKAGRNNATGDGGGHSGSGSIN